MTSSRLDYGDDDDVDGGCDRRFRHRRRLMILIHRNMRLHSIAGTYHILSKNETESEIETDGRFLIMLLLLFLSMLLFSWKTSTAMRIPKVLTMQL